MLVEIALELYRFGVSQDGETYAVSLSGAEVVADSSYVSRIVNLTTRPPDIVVAILDETLPLELTLFQLGG